MAECCDSNSFDGALKAAASQTDRAIAADSFPGAVEPLSLREAVRAYPMRGGKRLRPALLMWSCGALGGDVSKALYAAAAVEIYHNWTLVHDDIIDGDEFRRGAPSAHVELARCAKESFGLDGEASSKHGRDMAILAGDIQQAWAVDILLRSTELGCEPALAVKLARRLQESVNRELVSGEALDVEFPLRRKSGLSKAEVERMLSWKTGSLLKFCAQCGGALALGCAEFDSPPLSCLGSFAESLGVAFQLRDDHLGVFGDESKFGKPLCADFKEGKPTLLFLEAMERLNESGRRELESLVGLPHYDESAVMRVRGLLEASGAAEASLRRAAELSKEAMESLRPLPEGGFKKLLCELADYILGRHF